VLVLVALTVGLAACGSDGRGSRAEGAPSSAHRTANAPDAAGSASPSSAGTSAASAARIIPVNGDLAEVVYALGLGDQVVATDISATYPPEAQKTPKIGYQRTLVAETILAHQPTIVLADDLAGPPETIEAVKAAGVDVVEIKREDTIDAPARKIRAVAAALGVPARGDALAATFEQQLAAARQAAAEALTTSPRPKVLALYLRGPNVQLVFGKGSGIDAVIAAAGGTDLGTEMGVIHSGPLSIESIVAAGPDVLLVTTTGLDSVGGIDGLLAIPGLDRTPAATHRRVAAFEDQFLYGLGPRTGELVAQLVTAFHPPASTTPSA
jgi:iron complex transport system substrate-binding protein